MMLAYVNKESGKKENGSSDTECESGDARQTLIEISPAPEVCEQNTKEQGIDAEVCAAIREPVVRLRTK
jgi:hypothetical protein